MITFKLKPKLFDLFQHCELKCSASCCGLHAFDFSEHWLSRWCEFRDANTIATALSDIEEIQTEMDGLDPETRIEIERYFTATTVTLSDHLNIIDNVLRSYSNEASIL